MPRIEPYGSWVSPITAELATGATASFSGLHLDGSDLYWLENRPREGGRCTVVRRSASGQIAELTPPGFNVRSTAHEYGGGAFAVKSGTLFFSNFDDQRIYKQVPGRAPESITPEAACRYADIIIDHRRGRLICVSEDHGAAGEPRNTIAAVGIDGSACHALITGNDFYSNPRLSPDGAHLAYLTWNHPNMPWDGCELLLAQVGADGAVGPGRRVAGGRSEAIFQPEWSPGGVLHFVSDSTGWWNLHQWKAGEVRPLCPMPAEFGRAMWSFGISTYGFATETRLLCTYTQQGTDHVAWLDTEARKLMPIHLPYTKVDLLQCSSEGAAFVGASPTSPTTIVCLNVNSGRFIPVRASSEIAIDNGFLSMPKTLEWASPGGVKVQGFYYAPTNPSYAAPDSARPPLLVLCHSGPSSAASSSLRYPVQYWTSRGFAVLDVNYSGSTGYGRAYRDRLRGQWGVNDVEDCCSGALFLAGSGAVDHTRMWIRGGSAGGFTALSCLARHSDVFVVGSIYYGVADLELLARDSHKFESHYLDGLIGPYPAQRDLYVARSPIRNVEDLRCALVLFQGDDDRVVPPAQSQLMFEAVRRKGLPTALLRFRGEGHGFRRADSLKRAQEAELYFLSRIFRFDLSESIEPIQIENLPGGI